MSGVKIHGAKALDKYLAELDDKVARKYLRKGINSYTTVIRRRMRQLLGQLVNKVTGNLHKSLKKRTKYDKRKGELLGLVYADRPMGAHAHLIEFGTKFARAFPFARPALDGTADEGRRIIRKKLIEAVRTEKAKGDAKP